MTEQHTLYKISIKVPVSPNELDDFTDLVDDAGYTVVTDLENGVLELRGEAPGYLPEEHTE